MTTIRNAITKIVLPNFERDMSKSVAKELAKAHTMTDCMLAPSVFAFERQSLRSGVSATTKRDFRMVKIDYAAPGKGLFQ